MAPLSHAGKSLLAGDLVPYYRDLSVDLSASVLLGQLPSQKDLSKRTRQKKPQYFL